MMNAIMELFEHAQWGEEGTEDELEAVVVKVGDSRATVWGVVVSFAAAYLLIALTHGSKTNQQPATDQL